MDPRLRRLLADRQQVQTVLREHPRIRVVETEGNPPEKYVVAFQVRGLVPKGEDAFEQADLHRAEVFLPRDYPRRAPYCRMVTPLFHPNVDPQKICIGDHWTAGQRLVELIIRIGEMITFQSYNVKSPLNATAAAWVEQNLHLLPLEQVDLTTGL